MQLPQKNFTSVQLPQKNVTSVQLPQKIHLCAIASKKFTSVQLPQKNSPLCNCLKLIVPHELPHVSGSRLTWLLTLGHPGKTRLGVCCPHCCPHQTRLGVCCFVVHITHLLRSSLCFARIAAFPVSVITRRIVLPVQASEGP